MTIKNVGIEDSYFSGHDYVGGIVAFSNATMLKIDNCYNAGTLYGINSLGGLVGIINGADRILKIENSYNFGTIKYDKSTGGIPAATGALVGNAGGNPIVTNSYYLEQENVREDWTNDLGTAASSTAFSNGTVATLLHGSGTAEDSLWGQNVNGGENHPTFFKGVDETTHEENVEGKGVVYGGPNVREVTLTYPNNETETITYVEGWGASLPATDKNGQMIIWYDGDDNFYIDVPATAIGNLSLHAVVFAPNGDGYYEIDNVAKLYKFAAIVNGGEGGVNGKLTDDIEVNKNVLTTASGVSKVNDDGSYKTDLGVPTNVWTPIGYFNSAEDYVAFTGMFDGDGHTISGLFVNDGNANAVGLFGVVENENKITIKNVGIKDSYFNADKGVGGIFGRFWGYDEATIENVYSEAVVVANQGAGGIVGDAMYAELLTITNAYNVGKVFCSNGGGSIVGYVAVAPVVIENCYNVVGDKPLVGTAEGAEVSVANSFYLGSSNSGNYGTNKSASDFENGTVLAALRDGEGGYVWVQAEGDKYPTIDIKASKNANTIVLDWTSAADSTTLVAAGYTDGAMVIVKDGKQFYADGAIYEGILSAAQVAAIGDKTLYPISGVELETVEGKLVATLNGDSNEPLLISTDVHVDKVIYNRNVQANTFCTIMLPFTVPVAAVSDHSFYKFRRVATDDPDYSYVVKVTSVTTTLKANRPYIMIDSKGSSQIEFVNVEDGLTLNTTAESYEASSTADGITWKMKGVYEYKQWQTGDSEIGRAYLFTAQALGKYKIGQFAKLASGASLRPMRMYLTAETSSPNGGLNRPSRYGISSIVMPENIGIEIEDEELDESVEETTVVKRITIVPMLVQSNRWFDMKGRALNGRPTAKGTYYYNGKRIIIK